VDSRIAAKQTGRVVIVQEPGVGEREEIRNRPSARPVSDQWVGICVAEAKGMSRGSGKADQPVCDGRVRSSCSSPTGSQVQNNVSSGTRNKLQSP
jgi:hypothetical protein